MHDTASKSGVELIAAERRRQVEAEGWTPEHDDQHEGAELAHAAALYALPADARQPVINGWATSVTVDLVCYLWPWWESQVRGPDWALWWKPTPEDRVRELVKAGALIAAEIDRLQRAAPVTSTEPPASEGDDHV
jgi:hypothetical protein